MRDLMRFGVVVVIFLIGEVLGKEVGGAKAYPVFPIGPTGIHASIEPGFKVVVRSIDKGSPSDKSSLQAGDFIYRAEGVAVEGPDPRVALGKAISLAEASDGVLDFGIVRAKDPSSLEKGVSISLEKIGAYRNSWPANCEKSEAVILKGARHVFSALKKDGSYQLGRERLGFNDLKACMASLFLLSTGDDAYLPAIGNHARILAKSAESRRNAGGHINWQLGYQGIFLSEYFLRTGDEIILPGLKGICDWAAEGQAAGGWGHGANPGPGYVQSGLLNHTTVPIVIAMILARECGVEFDEKAYRRGVKFLYRMVGHGCVPYGDHRSELWWSNTNGRNAMLACALSLLDEKRFQLASEHLALLVSDSYYQPEFGHTGGGFNMMWRGIASVHVSEKKRNHYHRQMNHLSWYYDLARMPDGGFSMLTTPPDNKRYFGRGWGVSLGLTYTAPLQNLRITGARKSKFSVEVSPLDFSWGADSDLTFLSSNNAEGFGDEDIPPHVAYEKLLGKTRALTSVEFCAKHLRHFSPLVRTWAAKRLKNISSEDSVRVLVEASNHKDPRVRRAAYDAVSGYDNWSRPFKTTIQPEIVSDHFLPAILKTLNDPGAAWWESDGALFALGCAKPKDIRDSLPMILKFAKHEEWYLREAAFWAIVGLRDSITGKEFNYLSDIYRDSRHVFARSSYDAGFRTILKSSKSLIDELSMERAIQGLGKTTHNPGVMEGYGAGAIHEAAHRTMMVLKHFDAQVYQYMIGDLVAYLDLWEPYYQHSVWLIMGSRWQPGIPKVLESLGEEGQPIVLALKRVQKRFRRFEGKRMGKDAANLERAIVKAIADWEVKYGPA
ncbi:DUF6288 domain-containing protein [Akkermansiaceae bacterium]|nr:DUF6288 domain-containing protein [Akkermansiaceae bacterium]